MITEKKRGEKKQVKPINLYDKNVAILKNYGNIKSKLILCNSLRKKGFEFDNNAKYRCQINDKKLDENIIRAKAKVFEYAYCNPWTYFLTLTIDSKKYDRKDLKTYYKDLSQWIRDYRKRDIVIKYLLIPELHKDGKTWHMHGFIYGFPAEELTENKNGYLDWKRYSDKFGYCSLDVIKSQEACSKYITKYISKNLSDCVTDLNAHMYYCSKGLKTATEIKRGSLTSDMSNPDYENDYVKIKWYDSNIPLETLAKLIND